MPTKTRKQKIRADLRRTTLPTHPSFSVNTPTLSNTSFKKTPLLKKMIYEQKSTGITQSVMHLSDQIAVKHDLARIGIFAFFAIAFQLVVYWLLQRR